MKRKLTKPKSLGLMSVAHAAHYLGIGERTLRRYVAENLIEHRRVGGLIKFERAALEEFARPVGGRSSNRSVRMRGSRT